MCVGAVVVAVLVCLFVTDSYVFIGLKRNIITDHEMRVSPENAHFLCFRVLPAAVRQESSDVWIVCV